MEKTWVVENIQQQKMKNKTLLKRAYDLVLVILNHRFLDIKPLPEKPKLTMIDSVF